jgi:signal transduction histidine kinase
VRGVTRTDAAVALGFVVASLVETVARDHAEPGRLAFEATGSLWLACLALRRRWPVGSLCVISAVSVAGAVVTALLWPAAPGGGGVWIFAMVLATFSVGAYGARRAAALGVLLPLLVALASDWSMHGWDQVSGVLFVTAFLGLLPTAVGRLVRVRNDRVATLQEQRGRIVQARRAQEESAVLAERLRTAERLQPTLLAGLQALATSAEAGADPGELESAARRLLARTREEVIALTQPVEGPPEVEVPVADHVRALRRSAQSWVVLGAGAVTVGLYVESTRALDPAASGWVTLAASVLVGAALALVSWRPVTATVLAWIAVSAYSHLLTPLDGSLSETGFALVTAFAVAALSRRRAALVGLAMCLVGQAVGVDSSDPAGAAVLLLLCWLGGLAVNEASRLVEQTRANNELLGRQEASAGARAVVAERLRLAREVHDAIGHSLTVVALQAGAARRLRITDPDRARAAVRTLAAAAREGVAGLLADDAHLDLDVLVNRVRATGLVVEADLGDVDLLEPVQRTIAFRIVQEGLTNVLRHAPGSHARVVVRPGAYAVEISVSNSAPSSRGRHAGTGRGLVGLRERVESVAGRIAWQERADGGFEVRARLPLSAFAVVTT